MPDPIDFSRFPTDWPAASDEATLQLSELLHQLSRHFDDCYHEQILRAHRARREQWRRRGEKHNYPGPQSKLPEEFYQQIFRRRPRS
jgi:hypothetical protein